MTGAAACSFIFIYTQSIVRSPSPHNAPAPRCQMPRHLGGQPRAHLTLRLCCHSCLLRGNTAEWYVWSPEGTESGLRRHVKPGRVSAPQGGEMEAETTSEGGRWGLRLLGGGVGIQCTNSRCLSASPMLLVFVSPLDLTRLPGDALVGRESGEGASPWAPCLLPLGGYTYQALPPSEALAKVKAATAFAARKSPLQLCPRRSEVPLSS